MPASRPLAAMTASRTAGVTRPPTPYTVSVGKQTRRAAASSPASRGASDGLRPGQVDDAGVAHVEAASTGAAGPPPGAAGVTGRTGTPRAARYSLAAAMVYVP